MSAQKIIYDLVKNKYGKQLEIDETFLDGIVAYVSDNRLEEITRAIVSEDEQRFLIESYVAPLVELPCSKLITFFKNYENLCEAKRVSNVIFDFALEAYKTGKPVSETSFKEHEEQFMTLAAKLNRASEGDTEITLLISETIMDVEYAIGKTDKMSMRLGRRVSDEKRRNNKKW